jgi:glutamate 5-kinase
VGSSALAARPDLPALLAAQFAELKKSGKSIVLVSSGAVALGIQRLGLKSRPTELAGLQAAASAGQSELMRRYDEALSPYGITPAQVLLTHGDLANRKRLNNARNVLAALLELRALPIINENDAVSTDELRFSDNDQLSAMVAPLVDAEALILLTDVPGVLDRHGTRISLLSNIDEFYDQGNGAGWGRGGMSSKLNAAEKARHSGAAVVIASAFGDRAIERILSGEDVGTCFPRAGSALRARQHWIAYTVRPRGAVLIDDGAATALLDHGKSLLPIGVVGLRGDFRRGDSVSVVTLAGKEIARGLTRLSALEVARAAGKKGTDLAAALGGDAEATVIKRDDLVMTQ